MTFVLWKIECLPSCTYVCHDRLIPYEKGVMIDVVRLDTLHLLPANDKTTLHSLQITNSHRQEVYSLCIIFPTIILRE
jgi:hypothetical protein